ncbi:MAG: YbbR-like domain-containing protein [Chloroflexota bacterium]
MRQPLRWLRENLSSLTLALFLAIVVWVSAVVSNDPAITRTFSQPIPLEIIGQDSGLVLRETPPGGVAVTVKAPQSVWDRLQSQPGQVHAWIDLSGLGAGEYTLPVNIRVGVTPYHIVRVVPEVVSLTLEPLASKSMPVEVVVIGEPALGYRKGALYLNPNQITVSGAKSLVDQVNRVQAEVDISGMSESQRRTLDLMVLDANGSELSGVRLSPDTVTANQTISLLGGYRNVVVKVATTGEPAEGYWLTNISVSPPNVTVFSTNPQLVEALPGYVETDTVDLSGLNDDVDIRVALKLPAGVDLAGEESVLVRLNIAALEGSLPITLPIDVVGLSPNYVAEISPNTVDVLISGPLPVLKALKTGNVRVIVDLSGRGPGSYQVTPIVDLLPTQLKVASILPESISVTIKVNTAVGGTPGALPTVTVQP